MFRFVIQLGSNGTVSTLTLFLALASTQFGTHILFFSVISWVALEKIQLAELTL